MARVDHPNVVQIYDAGVHDDELFLAMELLPGPTLRLCEDRPWRDIVRLYVEAGRGLEALHHAGLVHRDFKPDNVLLSSAGTAKVMDLGLAKRLQAVVTTEGSSTHGSSVRAIPAGSFPYLAPELFEGRSADAFSDQFAFCVSLFETLAGRRPFDAESPWGHWLAVTSERPSARRREMPRAIWALLERGLDRDPIRRWSTMRELVERLERCLARRVPRAVLGLAAIGAVGVAIPTPTPDRQSIPPTQACIEPISLAWTEEARHKVDEHFARLRGDTRFPGALFAIERVEGALTRLEAMNEPECATPAEAICRARLATKLQLTMETLAAIEADGVGRAWSLALPLSDECTVIDDPAPLEDVVAIEEALMQAGQRGLDGGLGAAHELVDGAIARAERTEVPGLIARTTMAGAAVLRDAGDTAGAVELYAQAAWAAGYGNRPEEANHAALSAAHAAAAELRDPVLAEHWLARADVDQAKQPLLWARLLATRALVAMADERFEDAEDDMREAARIRSALAPQDLESAQTWSAVAAMLQHQGRHLEALRLHAHALEMLVDATDPLHPDVTVPLYGLAVAYLLVGDFEPAELLTRTLIDIEPLSHGPDHPSHVYNGLLLVEILAQQERTAEALRALDSVETLAAGQLDPGHPLRESLAETRRNLLQPT